MATRRRSEREGSLKRVGHEAADKSKVEALKYAETPYMEESRIMDAEHLARVERALVR
jgi:hypothetical protein